MKTYNTISNALNLAMIDHGNPVTWETLEQGNPDYIKNYLLPYLKGAKVCDQMTDCFSATYTDLAGNSMADTIQSLPSNPFTIQLPDGVVIMQPVGDAIIFDTNGQKGPNVFGRDLLCVDAVNKNDDPTVYSGKPLYIPSDPEDVQEQITSCIESKGANISFCALKLLKEGTMNY